ncbi:unnamed protein product [Choristocarpus tenellus]
MAYTFSQTLRSLVRGLNIVGVRLALPFERVIAMDMAPRLDEAPTYRIYVEIMASRSNVILVAVDSQGSETVSACSYQVSPTKSVRPLSTGQPYSPPPALTARRPFLEESLEDFVGTLGRVPTQQLKKALVSLYQGTSPVLVNLMVSCVEGLTPNTRIGDISQEQWAALHSGPWRRWLELVGNNGGISINVNKGQEDNIGVGQKRKWTPWLAPDGSGYYPTQFGGMSSFGEGEQGKELEEACGVRSSLQDVMAVYYGSHQSTEEFDGLRKSCMGRIAATLVKLRERVADFEERLDAAEEDKVAELNLRGDLLTTYGHAWQQGQEHVDCFDFETGEPVRLEIDPLKTPVEQAQTCYKLGKKLKRSASVVRELLEQVSRVIVRCCFFVTHVRGGARHVC